MARLFSDVLRDIGSGVTIEHLTSELARVVQAVVDTRKVGEITLKLKIKPNGENSVIIEDDVKVKAPEYSRPTSTFFANSEGSLSREDPRQTKLPLREVGGHVAHNRETGS